MPPPVVRHADLIYDVGLHRGEDSEFYLRKGFRVVAFEADPERIAEARARLAPYLADGRLTIVEGAIVSPDALQAGQTTVRFYKNDQVSVWGTTDAAWASRNARLGATSHVVEVAAIDFAAALRRYGVPYYLKVDIEGADLICIDALRSLDARPAYVSLESDKTSLAGVKREIDLLVELGYDSFQAIEQSLLPEQQSPPETPLEGTYVAYRFPEGSSGLFGAELPDAWQPTAAILRRYRAIMAGYRLLGDDGLMNSWRFRGAPRLRARAERALQRWTGGAVPGWYDTHARHRTVGS